MLLRPQVVIAGALAPTARKALASSGVQLCSAGRMSWSKKPMFLRNVPITAVNPTKGQMAIREEFARIAHGARGVRGLDPETGLPGAAAAIQRGMRRGGY